MAEIRLHVREALGDLPMACMRCGEPAIVTKSRDMSWYPPWVNILVLVGVLPAAIVAYILTKKARVMAPFCQRHKRHWLNRTLLIVGTMFLLPVLGVIGLVISDNLPRNVRDTVAPFLCVGGLVAVVAWLVLIVVLHHTSIYPKEITDDEILLTGVCEAFVEAVHAADLKRAERKRRRLRDYDDEDDEEPRPPSKSSSAAIKEGERRRKKPRGDAIEE